SATATAAAATARRRRRARRRPRHRKQQRTCSRLARPTPRRNHDGNRDPRANKPAMTAALDTAHKPGLSLTRIAHWVVLSWGWRRALVAFAAGGFSVLALAPFDAWPVLFLTFPVLVWLVDGAAAGRLGGVPSAAIAGWWFGFGYHL